MKRYGPAILSALLILIIAAGALFLSNSRRAELGEKPRPEPPVYAVFTETAEAGSLVVNRKYVGVLEAVASSTISFRVTGEITTAEKDAGDRVDSGEKLAKVDSKALERQKQALIAELEGAQSELIRAEQRLARRQPLLEKEHIDRDTFEDAKTAYETARSRANALSARLASARIEIAYTTAHAPFDGLITRRYKQHGDLAMPGEPIYAMENPAAGFKIMARIPRETALFVAPGDRALVRFGDRTIDTALHRIHPSTNESSLAAAEFRLENRPFDLPTGAFVGVEMPIVETTGILLSGRSILEDESGARVFRIDNENRVQAVNVTVKGRQEARAVITGPIEAGNRLVRAEEAMLLRLKHGQKIRPMPLADGSHDRSSGSAYGSSTVRFRDASANENRGTAR